ncbi:MAG: polysaccharide export protein [Granulosicoccus sp.]|nr:polysaccharide export protein [Granulosicoccus sp.]
MIRVLSISIVLIYLLALSNELAAQSVNSSALETSDNELQAAELIKDATNALPPGDIAPEPFGAQLFRGGFSNDREDGLNPDYIIQPGDRISVRVWGATQFNDSLVVDHQGNIFLPTVGPISVHGVSNRDLNQRVASAVGGVFTDNVKVYTSLDGTQPVGVFVTGYVVSPGRFAGIPSNSVLYFLDRAGGVESARGSYRKIAVQRDGNHLAHIDLYDFLRRGQLPAIQFQDGDVIVVGQRGPSVRATGDINNQGLFEFPGTSMSGAHLAELAMSRAGVNYVGVSGIRHGEPWSSYLPLEDFLTSELFDGDEVHFRVDQNDSVIVVDVEGSHRGPSRYAIPRNTRLLELLDYIEVDSELANLSAISLKRRQVALRQANALNESLRRLQSRYLTASSQTDAESAIRAREAELIKQFVDTASKVKPNGRLVVSRQGQVANVMLQSGDTITIPSTSESVLLSGEVLISQAILYQRGLRALDYIERSGGFSTQADTDRLVVVHANGAVSSGNNPPISVGDEIIVLPKVPVKNLQIASTIVDILYKVAVAASVAINL